MIAERAASRWAVAAGLAMFALLPACGGGGGGSGGNNGGSGPSLDDSVSFLGLTFRLGTGETVEVAPAEDPTASPPSLGASLNTTVIFRFDGVPEGPFNPLTLPVFTTPADVTPLVTPPGDVTMILAKGTYHLVDETVEFRPFVPSAPIEIDLTAPAEAVPGLLPGSIYTARVSTGLHQLGNLDGVGAEEQFGTTSNANAFYPTDASVADPLAVVSSTPDDGAMDFFPGVFSSTPLGGVAPSFPDGDDQFLITFDKVIAPTTANIFGSDLDGDGVDDPSFFLRGRGTQLLVSHDVPADAFGGGHAEFAAVSGYDPADTVDPSGADVVLHAGTALADPDAGLSAVPSALAFDAGSGLLWTVLPVDGGDDQLTVADHILGDPRFAALAEDGSGFAGAPAALDTGLDDIGALVSTRDGRLLAYDRTTRRIHELLPTVVRRPLGVDQPDVLGPVLVSLTSGDGVDGFLSQPLSDPGAVADPDVHGLAQAPSGDLLALATLGGAPSPSIIRLRSVDRDLNDVFDALDGTFSGDADDILVSLASDVADIVCEREGSVLALDRDADAIVRIDLETGASTPVLQDVAGFGSLGAGDSSPAVAFEVGYLDFDVHISLVSNGEAGAVVRLEPASLLPPGLQLDVMMRHAVTTLFGTSHANADPSAPLSQLGAIRLLGVTVAEPSGGAGVPIDDAFVEDFEDAAFEETGLVATNPPAEWGVQLASGLSSGVLRASVGVSETSMLGDFLPLAEPDFNPDFAWLRSSGDPADPDLDISNPGFRVVFLDTEAQVFPLPDGSTPGVTENTTVVGGRFTFRDIIIPESVRVVAKGSRPLVLTATRTVRIEGLIDASGINGFSDDTFDSGFLPVPGGPGGPGGGRGGDGHPSLFDPSGPSALDQYVTPETGEHGYGPVVGPGGVINFAPIGGRGGVSTAGYDPTATGYPKVPSAENTEFHRPPGGGGGSYYFRGDTSHTGAGSYLVQSNSTWFPFTKCVLNDKIRDALYGNEEHFFCGGGTPTTPLQCVYMVGTPEDPERFLDGALPGVELFPDGDRSNDYIGVGGELTSLIGGQGGGGGGTRIDSLRHGWWSNDVLGTPILPPIGPPCYPKLFGGVYFSPTRFDAKGAGAGGGGGAIQIRSFGDLYIGRTGHLDASGGQGGGGEVVTNSNFVGGGGGGSGGAILLQAAGRVVLEADPTHTSAGFVDTDGDHGASLDVGGGFGRDARTAPGNITSFAFFRYEVTRSDAAQGGFGLIQLQSGTEGGLPEIQQGAFAFARKRAEFKAGKWTGTPQDFAAQTEHPSWDSNDPLVHPPAELRYIEMMHYRHHEAEEGGQLDRFYNLNGSFPPTTPSTTGLNGHGPLNEYPPGSGQLWWDTKMIEHPPGSGRYVVQDPEPEWIFETYNGYTEVYDDLGQLLKINENNFNNQHPDFPGMPGTTYVGQEIPMSIKIVRPDGTPPMVEIDGEMQWDPQHLIDRLPLVAPGVAPSLFGTVSHGTSRWLDYAGMTLRTRSDAGFTPPFFEAFQGTYNPAHGTVPVGKDGAVVTGGSVPTKPADYVENSGPPPFDPGLFGNGSPPDPMFNDLAVHSPDINEQNALTDNATVFVRFQGAHPVRPGSHVPDEATVTEWVSDLTSLDGYALVRFRVAFDLAKDVDEFPFGVDSYRPVVDELRLRSTY